MDWWKQRSWNLHVSEIAGNLTSRPHYQIKGKATNYVKFGKYRTFPLNPVSMESMLKSKSLSKTLKYVRKSHQSPTRLFANDWKFLIAKQKRVRKRMKLKGRASAEQCKTSEDKEAKRISWECTISLLNVKRWLMRDLDRGAIVLS